MYSVFVLIGILMGGLIDLIVFVNGSGDVVLEVWDIELVMVLFVSFWVVFIVLGYFYVGVVVVFMNFLDIQKDDQIYGIDGDDWIGVYDVGGIFFGYFGNDMFVVNEGVFGVEIYGIVIDGFGVDVQFDVVEIRGNVFGIQFYNIDVFCFGDMSGSKMLIFNGFV